MELAANPFFVLELGPEATVMEIERKTQKLLAELELGRASAKTYRSPFGERPRDAEAVRAASRALRDPTLREQHALLVPPSDLWPDDVTSPIRAADTRFPELRESLAGTPLAELA